MVLALALVLLTTAATPDDSARVEDGYALTLSGGVSLGSYEAGLNWALVRGFRARMGEMLLRRRPRLVGVTGASAGGINALLAAALYCETDESAARSSVDDNLLRSAWLNVGLDSLLPEDPRTYRPDDAVLASAALEPVLADVRKALFDGGMAFRPRCRLPMGLTVTRVRPLEQDVGGLRITSQRAVLPLLFDIDAAGKVRFERQPLPGALDATESRLALADVAEMGKLGVHPEVVLQSLLASAAFPVAFRPRVLCECATGCGADPEAPEGTCPGPQGTPLTGLSCQAHSAAQGGRPLKVCMRRFVDGGVFDNAPVGLALEQSEAFWRPGIMKPLTALFVDPDSRRLQPSKRREEADPGLRGIGAIATFAGDLVQTARNRELSRAAQAGRWNRTTRRLLLTTSGHIRDYLTLLAELLDLEGPPPSPALPPALHGTPPERARFARTLQSCLVRLAPRSLDASSEALGRQCGGFFRGEAVADPLQSDPPLRARAAEPLSETELVDLVGLVSQTFGDRSSPARESAERKMLDPITPPRSRIEMGRALADRLEIVSLFEIYLAEQLGLLSHGELPEARLLQVRRDVLGNLTQAEALGPSSARVAAAQLEDALVTLARRSGPGAIPDEARRVLSEVRAESPGTLFAIAPLLPLLAALDELPASMVDPPLLRAWQRVDRLVQLRPRLQTLAADTVQVAQDARALLSEGTAERTLALSTRFSPLAGAQLANFGGFLDPPLREFDYYAGIYDGLHSAALFVCREQDPAEQKRPAPVRLGNSWELDTSQLETQRCVGAAMGQLAALLGIERSAKASTLIAWLARAELAAGLGSSSETEKELARTEWSWLGPPRDPRSLGSLGIVGYVLLSQKSPCTEQDREALCISDVTFDEFLTALAEAGYRPESRAMRLAIEDRTQFWRETLQRGVDRAATIELTSGAPSETGQRKGILFALSAGEVWTRGDVNGSSVRFTLDPSTIPSVPLADGPRWAIWAAHAVPYRAALDVARGGLALSWIEPALRLGPHASVLSTLQLVDIEFGQRTSSTFGLRPAIHLGGLTVSAGPRFAVHWNGGTDWGGEVGVSLLQERLGVAVGVRQLSGLNDVFVALSVSDVNGMIYWLMPWAERRKVTVTDPARPAP
ncbi:MAG TPA: patatin-like phospholipase family protein [Myxococcaceae bacterium]|nr:patatin-like phospholipase family protein [Myxococcaceae bacterium]